jgi:hypothetical protein
MKLKTFKLFNESILAQAGNSELYNLAETLINNTHLNKHYINIFLDLFNKDQSIFSTTNDVKAAVKTYTELIKNKKTFGNYENFIEFIEEELISGNWSLNNNLIEQLANSVIFLYENNSNIKGHNMSDMYGREEIGRIGHINLVDPKFALYGINPYLELFIVENKNEVYFLCLGWYDDNILYWNKKTNQILISNYIENLNDIFKNNPMLEMYLLHQVAHDFNETQDVINKVISDTKNMFDNRKYASTLNKIDFYDKLDINWDDFA